jgi:uncharacterized membrane protein YfcA
MTYDIAILTTLIFLAAMLYSTVGHAGASGYLAVMALMGIAPAIMKPTALSLNILVAIIACTQFCRSGRFSWRLFWPLALTSIPCAYIAGGLAIPNHLYKPILGVILIYAAGYSLIRVKQKESIVDIAHPPIYQLLIIGGLLGFLSGLTGVGGGIFLSPLLLMLGWAPVNIISGISAAFILVNSTAGILGLLLHSSLQLPDGIVYWAIAAALGGSIGAKLGSKHLANSSIARLLAVVLLIAGIKMLLI